MNTQDTIAAISTAQIPSALGIIRLSGPMSLKITSKIFRPSDKQKSAAFSSHTLRHGWILSSNNKYLDEVIVSFMRAPKSYTGQDVIEISAHGGPVILNQILKLCIQFGARQAKPGEFTFRAFINGKKDLSQAQAVADIIASKTQAAAQSAARQLAGELSNQINRWKDLIVEIAAQIEAELDYPEDIDVSENNKLSTKLTLLAKQINNLKDTYQKGRILRHGLRIAIIGKPNAGKSSLLNTLLAKERSIVTNIPGTTRDTIEESFDCQGLAIAITDTAGLRNHTANLVEKIGQERTIECMIDADLVVWLLDASKKISKEDFLINNLINAKHAASKTFITANKIDLPQKLTLKSIKNTFKGYKNYLAVSAVSKIGLKAFEKAILKFSFWQKFGNEILIVDSLHEKILSDVKLELLQASKTIQKTQYQEIAAFHLRHALDLLSEITGETTAENILDQIFSKFCVGK